MAQRSKKKKSKFAKARVSDEELIRRREDEAPEVVNLTVDFDEAVGLVLDTDSMDIDRHLAELREVAKTRRARK
jgi:hypothetical protein